jgi:hypothetical protein
VFLSRAPALAALVALSVITLFPRPAAADSESSKFAVKVTRAWIDAEPHIEGKANLENGEELEILISTEQEGALALGHAKMNGGQFRSGKFNTDIGGGQPLRPGRYIVEITALDQGTPDPIYAKTLSITSSRKSASSINATEGKTSNETLREQLDNSAKIETPVTELLKPIFGERLREVDALYSGHSAVRISFLAGAKGELAVRATRTEMRNAYQAIFMSDVKGIDEVILLAYAPVMDELGNATMQIVYATHMSKNVAGMINWKNKDSLDFTKLWETQTQDARWTQGK